ncbi:MAG: hypothetical protein K0S30_133 [Clostridia bacterium]|nr:hypothetical protein [Clostridia bacterium]
MLFIIMLGAIVAIPYSMRDSQKDDKVITEETIDEVNIDLFVLDVQTISRIEIKDESALTLESRDNQWISPEYTNLFFSQDKVKEIIRTAASLESVQVIQNVESQSKYGIDEKAKLITLYDGQNKNYTLRIGAYTPDKKGVYIATDREAVVYVADSETVLPLLEKQEDLIENQMQLPPLDKIEKLEISKKGEKNILIQKNKAVGYEGYETWGLDEFFSSSHQVHTEMVEDLIWQIMSFQKDKLVGEKVDLAKYELENPYLVVDLNETCDVRFGKKEGGYVYFTYSEEPYVYKMLEERIKVIENIEPMAFIRKPVYIPDLSKLSKIVLTNPEKQITVGLQKQLKEQEAFTVTSVIDGKIFDEAETEVMMQLIANSVCIEALLQNPQIEQKQERKAEITITYSYEDGTSQTIELIPYDGSFYILRFEDTIEFAVGRDKVMTMFNQLYGMIKSNN